MREKFSSRTGLLFPLHLTEHLSYKENAILSEILRFAQNDILARNGTFREPLIRPCLKNDKTPN